MHTLEPIRLLYTIPFHDAVCSWLFSSSCSSQEQVVTMNEGVHREVYLYVQAASHKMIG